MLGSSGISRNLGRGFRFRQITVIACVLTSCQVGWWNTVALVRQSTVEVLCRGCEVVDYLCEEWKIFGI